MECPRLGGRRRSLGGNMDGRQCRPPNRHDYCERGSAPHHKASTSIQTANTGGARQNYTHRFSSFTIRQLEHVERVAGVGMIDIGAQEPGDLLQITSHACRNRDVLLAVDAVSDWKSLYSI